MNGAQSRVVLVAQRFGEVLLRLTRAGEGVKCMPRNGAHRNPDITRPSGAKAFPAFPAVPLPGPWGLPAEEVSA